MQRFSRYFARPASFGLVNVRPAAAYRHVYPFTPAVLHDIAYLFDADTAPTMCSDPGLEQERAAFLRELDEWLAVRPGVPGQAKREVA